MQALWLCLHLPELALDALGPWPHGVLLPTVVWQGERGGQRVWLANEAARALGIGPGQRQASAQALAPQAVVLARDPAREADYLHHLAQALAHLTPSTLVEGTDVLLEIHASLRLFGGLRALLRRARHIARQLQACGQWGLAPTPLAARLLARLPCRQIKPHSTLRRLHRLPLGLLAEVAELPVAPLQMLRALGTRRLADLHALPRSGLARRGALAWLEALDRATGQRPDPKRWLAVPEHFEARLELAWRVDSAPALESALTPLLHSLAGWLRLRWQSATRLSLHLQPERGTRRHLPAQVLTLQLATPTRDAAHLQTLLRERLQLTVLAAPVDTLRLHLDHAVPDAGRPTTLLPEAPDAAEQAATEAELIDRLRARLGHDQVQRIALQADARPEKADHCLAPDIPYPTLPNDPLLALRPRPAWLLPEPLRLAERQDQPWLNGQPLQLLPGTERIEVGWHDGWLVRRDYHVAVSADGALHWLYLERPRPQSGTSSSPNEPPHWYLHGLFA